eukprot:CAMPEP_0204337018 /NCGR_PEP_ID=MMETSP0469-20131031/19985_1 /ASSEMBLY_ACC=CAM_ASM_000384 /TAXON_ID=2969 /ORGANISM="Oxyrrhis marina" /LENGTH=211 /DNA_ID=CAMNT_0051320981 /DNA_START=20 /DNA_END=651 /DNA_ORIENTATION=-
MVELDLSALERVAKAKHSAPAQGQKKGIPRGHLLTIWVKLNQVPVKFCTSAILQCFATRKCAGRKVSRGIVRSLQKQGCSCTAVPPTGQWDSAVVVETTPWWLGVSLAMSLAPFEAAVMKGLTKKGLDCDLVVQWQDLPQDCSFSKGLPFWKFAESCSLCSAAFGMFRRRRHCVRCGATCCRDCVFVADGRHTCPACACPDAPAVPPARPS